MASAKENPTSGAGASLAARYGDGSDNVAPHRTYTTFKRQAFQPRRSPVNSRKSRGIVCVLVIFLIGVVFGYFLNDTLHSSISCKKWNAEMERERHALRWESPTPAKHCSRPGTREYSARLTIVGLKLNAIEECTRKPLQFHGRAVLPSRCESHAVSGQVTGHWIIDFNEAACGDSWFSWLWDMVAVITFFIWRLIAVVSFL